MTERLGRDTILTYMKRAIRQLLVAAGATLASAAMFPLHGAYIDLKVTEIMYRPNGADASFEFLEVKNTGATELNMANAGFTAGIHFTFPAMSLGTGRCAVVVVNLADFASRYDTNGMIIAGVWTNGDRLSNAGEQLVLRDPSSNVVAAFTYTNTWYPYTDGVGFSMVPRSPSAVGDPNTNTFWRNSTFVDGSPGRDDPEPVHANVLVTEALTHTDWPDVDAIELYNPGDVAVDMSGWWLTDDATNAMKHRIVDGVSIAPKGYCVILGDNDADPSNSVPASYFGGAFLLSEYGEQVHVFSSDLQYSNGFAFGAAINGVSFGRTVTSDGQVYFPMQCTNSLGSNNLGPRIESIVLAELMYAPGPYDREFLELANKSNGPSFLYDPLNPANTWKVPEIGFVFPTNVSIAATQRLVLVRDTIGTNEFRTYKGIPAGITVINYTGSLASAANGVTLVRPDHPDPGFLPYVVVDEVRYKASPQWPTNANGTGRGIERVSGFVYGNEPTNWFVSIYGGSPGTVAPADSDKDGLPDNWETANGLSSSNPDDSISDTDGDSVTNYVEFLYGCSPTNADTDGDVLMDDAELIAGTSPTNGADCFMITNVIALTTSQVCIWNSMSGRFYTVQTTTNMFAGWSNVADSAWINIAGVNGPLCYTNGAGVAPSRFFRIMVWKP